MNILFIDSDEQQRQRWVDALITYSPGYICFHAADGRTGLAVAAREHVDCVILELNLPDRSGLAILLELVRFVRSPQMPVVVLTEVPLELISDIALRNGAQSCLAKEPIIIADLDVAIRNAVAAVSPNRRIPASYG
jgi:DNA-binding response OmpR family regulator